MRWLEGIAFVCGNPVTLFMDGRRDIAFHPACWEASPSTGWVEVYACMGVQI